MSDNDPIDFRPMQRKFLDPEERMVTETIDLDSLFTKSLSSSGSFDIRGGIWTTTFGKVMQALPIPALLIDECYRVVVSNQACRKISPNYEKIHGEPVAALFVTDSDQAKALSVVEAVFSSRKPRVLESFVEIEGKRIWGRTTFRSIRIADERLILALIEDLTLERKRRLEDKKHQENLEKLVKERTSELESATEQLRKEISVRMGVERRLLKSKETVEALLNATSDMAFLMGADGTFRAVNKQVARQFSAPEVKLLGKSIFELAPDGFAGVQKGRFHEVMHSAKPVRFEAEQFGRFYDNNLFPVVDLEGIVVAVAVYVRDVTAEKKTNELLMQSARIKAVGDMASGVAHNFNNVLQIVINAAYDILADLELDNLSEAKTNIKRIIKSALAGADTVRRLQDFAHARTGEATVGGEVFNLSSTVEQTLEILKPCWKTNPEKRGIKIRLHQNLSRDCLVRGKENEIFEVVVNLIKNAVEALPSGGDIKISTSVDDVQVCLKIQDNGVGIAEANLENIFEPFWSTKGVDGIGMGLASSYGIVKRHKGAIFVKSTAGHRTEFTVKLPLEKKSSEKMEQPPANRAQCSYRVLVIDDSEDSVWVLRNGLARSGQEVLAAVSGRQGIDIFKNEQVDAVICDLGMPEINGWDVGKTLKQICMERGVPKPPFILLTGWGGLLDEKEKLLECGVDRIVEKPYPVKNLLELVRDLVEGQS